MAVSITNISPLSNAATNNNKPSFSAKVTDPDEQVVSVTLFAMIWRDDNPQEVYSLQSGYHPSGTQISMTFYQSLLDGVYRWRLQASSNDGESLLSTTQTPERILTIDTVEPNSPSCSIAALSSTSIRVTSSAFSDPSPSSGYGSRIAYLARWNGSSWVSHSNKTFASSSSESVDFTGLDPAQQYRVRVKHSDRAGNSAFSDYATPTLNSAPTAPMIATPTTSGSTFNQRPKVIVNVPTDTDGDMVRVKAVFKNGATTICTVESGYVTQGTGTVTLTPTANVGTGTITVELSAYDGSEWSTTNSYTFTVVAEPSFPVLATDTGIRAAYLNNLTAWINNARQFRGLAVFSFTDGTVTANTTQVKATHLTERRTKVGDALAVVGIMPTWTDATIIANLTERKGAHWLEIFNYLKQI